MLASSDIWDSTLLHAYDPEGTGELMWMREWAHSSCAYGLVAHEGLRTLAKTNRRTALRSRERSWPAYLLLLEIGLPLDIAWPIVAIAYWLL